MKIDEVLPQYNTVKTTVDPVTGKKIKLYDPNAGMIRKTIAQQASDIGSFYVHGQPSSQLGFGTVTGKDATPSSPVAPEKEKSPAQEPAPSSEKDKPVDKKSPVTNVLKTVKTKSGAILSKDNTGVWRTEQGQIIDLPELVAKLEKMSSAPSGQAAMQTTPRTPADIPSRRRRVR